MQRTSWMRHRNRGQITKVTLPQLARHRENGTATAATLYNGIWPAAPLPCVSSLTDMCPRHATVLHVEVESPNGCHSNSGRPRICLHISCKGASAGSSPTPGKGIGCLTCNCRSSCLYEVRSLRKDAYSCEVPPLLGSFRQSSPTGSSTWPHAPVEKSLLR